MKLYVVNKNTDAFVVNRSEENPLAIPYKTKRDLETSVTLTNPISYANGRRVTFGNPTFNALMNNLSVDHFIFPDTEHNTDWFLAVPIRDVTMVG